MTFKDQLQRTLVFKETPKRIISLVPSQTELLVDLGLENHLVGITKFCVHPKHLRKTKTLVGGTKEIKLEKIKALKPEVILCNKEENTQDIVAACSDICPVHVSDIYTIKDSLDLIKQYGDLFSVQENSRRIIDAITKELDVFQTLIKDSDSLKVAYFIWRNPWMVAANSTYINEMLKLNGFKNVFENLERYLEIGLETLQEYQPELVLLSSEPYPFKEKHKMEIEDLLPNARIILVDGEAFSWYGTRLIKSFDYFKKLYQELGAN